MENKLLCIVVPCQYHFCTGDASASCVEVWS